MKSDAKKEQEKAELIKRLISKASLDFKCCGHGHLLKKD